MLGHEHEAGGSERQQRRAQVVDHVPDPLLRRGQEYPRHQ